jgi:formyltetrahydrofolate deformylase
MADGTATVPKAILLFSCPDARGIVADVSHFIFTYGGNIAHSSQHNDPETGTFFMRVEWELEHFTIPREKIWPAFEPIAEKFDMDCLLHFSDRRTRTAVFVSKYDHCLFDLLLRNKEGELDTEIALIVSNHRKLEHIAEWFGIPFYYFPISKDTKEEVEREEIDLLKREQIDLVVLARYMQILTDQFVDAFPNRIINIHHSFLPAFVGAKPYHQAFARGVKIIGATSHYVTSKLDEGPIIEQDVTRISHRDAIPDLVSKGRNLERLVLSRAVSLHLQHRVLVFKNKTVVFE